MTWRSIVLMLALLAGVRSAYAAESGIAGTITAGPRAEPIANARVALQSGGQSRVTTTDDRGRYEFTSLVPGGPYEVTV